MKYLASTACAAMLFFSALNVSAQIKTDAAAKPVLFNAYPDAIKCKQTELKEVFKSLAGQNATVSFSGTPMFSAL